ncbi:hypothetical protein BG46_01500 [Brucella anthropi]|uniref:hypothetical protein n=1 Tax=Brucella anthropi TaxID=529 RepID=UPI0004464B6D|nr:hypothetical protein [Brucella anthropi]EXL08578.1 hypothetical protein BG46_01500 [Brucella anthropi]
MVQRGWLNLGQGVFRVSAPGVDVKTAAPNQLLLDERVIYPQIIQSIFVPFVSPNNVVTVPITDYGFIPNCYAYGRYAGEDNRSFPARAAYTSQSNQLQNHFYYIVSSNQITVEFAVPTFLRGAQLITLRP